MSASETVTMTGHLIDAGLLARVLDAVMERGADYEIASFQVGKHHDDESTATVVITAPDEILLREILLDVSNFGAVSTEPSDAEWEVADMDGAFPDDFYSTTNLPTQVRIDGQWVDVALPEMDCGVRLGADGVATTVPMLDVRAGDRILVRFAGVRVLPGRSQPSPGQDRTQFAFMSSDVSSEKPQSLMVHQVAEEMRACRERGEGILWVAGPALVHTGSVPPTVALIRAGYMQILFAGNALPTHDIEAAIFGTSLGVSQSLGVPTDHGHSHHIRAVNSVRRAGSIAQAVADGVIRSGIMHACVNQGVEWVLAGSVRDDGPLPDVVTDMIEAQSRMRALVPQVGFCIVVSTMLHGIATGNLLPASVPFVCVDINPATVTKLADRGSAQAVGMVTDVGLFVKELAEELAPDELAEELEKARERGGVPA